MASVRLTRGERNSTNGKIDYIFASEPSVFYALGFESKSDVAPGEVIYITEDGQYHSKILSEARNSLLVYLSMSTLLDRMQSFDDVSVYRSRLRMGQNLAKFLEEKIFLPLFQI